MKAKNSVKKGRRATRALHFSSVLRLIANSFEGVKIPTLLFFRVRNEARSVLVLANQKSCLKKRVARPHRFSLKGFCSQGFR